MKPESKAWLVKFGLTLILGLGILTRSSCMIGNPSEENDRPEGPSGLGARLGSIHLTWQDNSDNEDGFIIERKIGNAGQFQQVGRVGADVTAYEDHYTPEQNMPVFYRVVAFNSKGQSNYSNTALVNSILWSGYQDVKIYGNYAYCSNANGLVVFDLAMLGAHLVGDMLLYILYLIPRLDERVLEAFYLVGNLDVGYGAAGYRVLLLAVKKRFAHRDAG